MRARTRARISSGPELIPAFSNSHNDAFSRLVYQKYLNPLTENGSIDRPRVCWVVCLQILLLPLTRFCVNQGKFIKNTNTLSVPYNCVAFHHQGAPPCRWWKRRRYSVWGSLLNFFRDCRGTATWFVASSDAPFCSVVCASGQCGSTWYDCLNGLWNGLCTAGARPDVAYLGTQNAFSFCVNMISTRVPPRGGNMCSSQGLKVYSSFWTALHFLSCLFVIILWGEILLGNLER